jgi:hypothetical protein
MNQNLSQKWFLVQNNKDSSLNHNGIFNNGEWTYSAVAFLVGFQYSVTISKFKLKKVYATKNTSMHLEHLKV